MALIEGLSKGIEDEALLQQAARLGFSLHCRTSDTGQTIWEWRRGDEPRPQFASARVACHWMHEWLAHGRDDQGD